MIQEIITYLLIGFAITITISKTYKKFKGKKKSKNINFKKEIFSTPHDCSSCDAECMLRDAVKPNTQNNQDLCKKAEVKSDML